MFTSNDIQALVQEWPFAPLRIATSDGENFEVRHPELIMVGRRQLVIGTASTESETQFERVRHVAILHVTSVEKLLESSVRPTNGQPS